jgi:hypothetical protein
MEDADLPLAVGSAATLKTALAASSGRAQSKSSSWNFFVRASIILSLIIGVAINLYLISHSI